MIVRAVQKKPCSFTDLLRITKLPRKTLSLRLKELLGMDVITKNGIYYLNDSDETKKLLKIQKNPIVIKRRMLIAFLVLAMMISAGLQASAIFVPRTCVPPQPTVLGYFEARVLITNVQELYGWQVVISYDADNTRWVEILPGVIDELPYTLNNTFPEMGLLLVGNTLIGKVEGFSGSGVLVSIKFAYYSEEFNEPTLLPKFMWHPTMLLDANGDLMQWDADTLELEIEYQS